MSLSCTLIPSAMTRAILDGAVRPQGIQIEFSSSNVDDNSRGMIAGRFDVAEMSIGTYVQARSRGADLIALPVFPARRFMQPCVLFGDGKIKAPGDLRGKRIAFPQFWMTSSVWHRGVMEHEYGVKASDVEFLTTQDERMEAPFTPGVRVRQIMNRPLAEFFTFFGDLVADGTADVIFAPRFPEDLFGLQLLYPDHVAASLAFRKRTGIYPLMHTVVAKGSVVREHSNLGASLLAMFNESKEQAYANKGKLDSPIAGVSFEESRTLLGGDPYPYGVTPNRASIDAFLQYASDQSLSSRRLSVEEAFLDPSHG